MKFCLYPHMTSLNRGCEAIIVSTCQILDKAFGADNAKTLLAGDEHDDRSLISKYIDNFLHYWFPSIKRYSVAWVENQFSKFIWHDPVRFLTKYYMKDVALLCKEQDVLLSIGGDNYCYGKPYSFYAINRCLKSMGKVTILWGCSIEPSSIDELMIDDLKNYDLIIARESITYQALLLHNLKNAVLCADPAFTLHVVNERTLETALGSNTIGINTSPMIIKYEKENGVTMKNYERLIQYIIDHTEMQIALIPHVTVYTTDDRVPLTQLYAKFKDTGRVILVDDHNCMELKGIISHCRMFIGARTHATIAAYSTCVPTLVVGYSVKARGIARDIFGTEKNMVIPVQNLDHEDDLVNAFKYIQENEDRIRKHLQRFMPSYIEKAWQAGEEVKKLIEK